jgi:hypothetical protein
MCNAPIADSVQYVVDSGSRPVDLVDMSPVDESLVDKNG